MTGAELRAWRKLRRVTRPMLAVALGVGVCTLKRWENDTKRAPWWLGVALETPEFSARLMRAVDRYPGSRSSPQQIKRAIGAQVASGGR